MVEHRARAQELSLKKAAMESSAKSKLRKPGGEAAEELEALRNITGDLDVAPPMRHRYVVNDATVQALSEVMAENSDGVILVRDELIGFLKSLDMESQQAASAFYLETLGRERALIYKTLVLTGLRKGELASLTVGQMVCNGSVATLILNAKDEKNRKGSAIPLRSDLAAELRSWLDEKLEDLQRETRRRGDPIPARLPANTKLLNVPTGMIRIFDRDLVFAGIARIEKHDGKEVVIKTDERGRTIDIHALRHTFGTHLCAAGVPLRIAQAAMRHSDPSLTANVYTDPKLLDVAGAMEALPRLAGVAPGMVSVANSHQSIEVP